METPRSGGGYWYLAGPYSDSPATRYEQHLDATAALVLADIHVYSPILSCHDMAIKHHMPTDAKFWENFNFTFVERSRGVIVLALKGWERSKGTRGEIAHAQKHGLPIWYLDEPTKLSGGAYSLKWSASCTNMEPNVSEAPC